MQEIKNKLDEFFTYIPENINDCNKIFCEYCNYYENLKNPLKCIQRNIFIDDKFNKKELCLPT